MFRHTMTNISWCSATTIVDIVILPHQFGLDENELLSIKDMNLGFSIDISCQKAGLDYTAKVLA